VNFTNAMKTMPPTSLGLSLAILCIAFISGCKRRSGWYEEARTRLAAVASEGTDSTVQRPSADSTRTTECFFSGGHRTISRDYYRDSRWIGETVYSRDGRFELRREICPTGQTTFEGIFYGGHYYGLSSSWACGDTLRLDQEGVRYRDQKVGTWKIWNDSAKTWKTRDYGHENLLDSLEALPLPQ